ncbi:MAG: efflux RND transporter periplasmic adaptor subunit, partial [Ottowia sp.]|nr:efflux RND transporter periplasmic adaptor subunit [Ottowia sp.]
AEAALARDRVNHDKAVADFKRLKILSAKGYSPQTRLDDAATLVDTAGAAVRASEAAVELANLNLAYATIRSPIDGRIGLRTVDPGNLVSAGSTTGIATVTQMNPIDVVFSVPQDRVPDVLAAQKAAGAGKLPVQALNRERTQQLAEGRFLTLDNQVNVSTGTVKAKARYANADGTLFPNQFVNVRLQLGTVSGVLVPVTAVRTGPQGDYVYVVDDQHTAHMRAVTRGLATVDQILIEKGVQAGERVVTEGGDRVKDGGKVQLGGSGGSGSGAGGGADDAAAGAAGASAGASAAGSAGRRRGASAPAGAGTAPVGASAAAPAASTGNSEPKVAPAQAQQAQAASNSGASSAPAGAASASTYNLDDPAKRPPWWDRLPPEVQQKLLAMSPDERRAYLQELRERRRAAREAGQ